MATFELHMFLHEFNPCKIIVVVVIVIDRHDPYVILVDRLLKRQRTGYNFCRSKLKYLHVKPFTQNDNISSLVFMHF